jgi:hypothetical protein
MDAKLYGLLQQTMDRFVSKERLVEMAHELDTNMNEAFNQICTWFCPKNKVYAGSYLLNNRIAFAVGINSLGVMEFFKRLFRKLGITMTDNVVHYLQIKDAVRLKKLANSKTSTAKKEKNKRKYEKLKEHTKIAKTELHKRMGTYRRGMNLDDPLEIIEGDTTKPAAKKRKTNSPQFCEYCGKKGHITKRSKRCDAALDSCKKYRKVDGTLLTEPPSTTTAPVAFDDAADDIRDCENFDSMPLVAMPGEEYCCDVEGTLDPTTFFGDDTIEEVGSEDDDSEGPLVRAIL